MLHYVASHNNYIALSFRWSVSSVFWSARRMKFSYIIFMSHSIEAHNSMRWMRARRTVSIEFLCRDWVSVRAVWLSSSMTAKVIDMVDDSYWIFIAETLISLGLHSCVDICDERIKFEKSYWRINILVKKIYVQYMFQSVYRFYLNVKSFANSNTDQYFFPSVRTWSFNFLCCHKLPCIKNIELHGIPLLLYPNTIRSLDFFYLFVT